MNKHILFTILSLLLLNFTQQVNGQACPQPVSNITASLSGGNDVVINFDIDCSGTSCPNGVLYYVGLYAQESEAPNGTNSEYGITTFQGAGCNFTELWDGGAGRDPKASTGPGVLLGRETNVFTPGPDATFDKDALCASGGGSYTMNTTITADQFCEGVTYDIRVWEIQTNVAPDGDLTAENIACVRDYTAESTVVELTNAVTIPGAITNISTPVISITGAASSINGNYSGCVNPITISCADEIVIDIDVTGVGGCFDNSMVGYALTNQGTSQCNNYLTNGFPATGAVLNEWDFIFADNLVDENGNPTPKIWANGNENPFEDVTIDQDVEICFFIQDMVNGSHNVSCLQFSLEVPPLVVVVTPNQGSCPPGNNNFDVTVTGGSSTYDITWDNSQIGNSGSANGVGSGSTQNVPLGTDGGTWNINVQDVGNEPNACEVNTIITFQPIITPRVILTPESYTICEGESTDIEVTIIRDIIVPIDVQTPSFYVGTGGAATSITGGGFPNPNTFQFNLMDNSVDINCTTLESGKIKQLCMDIEADNWDDILITLDNPNTTPYTYDMIIAGANTTYFAEDGADTPGTATGSGRRTVCFDAGTPLMNGDGTFDGTFDGDFELVAQADMVAGGDWYGSNSNDLEIYFQNSSININDDLFVHEVYMIIESCELQPQEVGFCTGANPNATWGGTGAEWSANDAPLNQTVTVTSNGADAGTTYSYTVDGFDAVGCCPATQASIDIEVIEASAVPVNFSIAEHFCIDDTDETITPNEISKFGGRGGITVYLVLDNYANETTAWTFSQLDATGNNPITISSGGGYAFNDRGSIIQIYDNSCAEVGDRGIADFRIDITDSGNDFIGYDTRFGFDFEYDSGLYFFEHSTGILYYYKGDGDATPNPATVGINPNDVSAIITEVDVTGNFSRDFIIQPYIEVGTLSGPGVTNDANIEFEWYAADAIEAGSPRIFTSVTPGTGIFSPSAAGLGCDYDIVYEYDNGCGCVTDVTEVTNVREKVVIDNANVVACTPDGTCRCNGESRRWLY